MLYFTSTALVEVSLFTVATTDVPIFGALAFGSKAISAQQKSVPLRAPLRS